MTIEWGANLSKTHLDAGTDDPAQARAELEAVVDRINARLTGVKLVVESDIDTRLGTTGNLGTAATIDLANLLQKSEFDPADATLVWSGSSTGVDISLLSETGAGLYLVVIKPGGVEFFHSVYVRSESVSNYGTARVFGGGVGNIDVEYARYVTEFSVQIVSTDAANSLQTITKIYKV